MYAKVDVLKHRQATTDAFKSYQSCCIVESLSFQKVIIYFIYTRKIKKMTL